MTMAYVCPLNPAHIIEVVEPGNPLQAMFALEVTPREGEHPAQALRRAAVEAQVAADEAMLLMHLEVHHSIREVALALGTARNALKDIQQSILTDARYQAGVGQFADGTLEACTRGLGE